MTKPINPLIFEQLATVKNPGMAQAATAFYNIYGDKPASEFLISGMNALCTDDEKGGTKQQKNGAVLELLFSILLIREGLNPFYAQADIIFVPNARFDILLFSKRKGIITISLKTSLRERWKQADLEALAVKQVHRRCISILASLPLDDRNTAEVENLKSKVADGNVHGLQMIVNLADQTDIEALIAILRDAVPCQAPTQLGPLLPSAKIIG